MTTLRTCVSWLAWPGLLALCLLITAGGFVLGRPTLFFNIAYAVLALCLFALERGMPHERSWNRNDGQTFANIAHTLLSKGLVQTLVVFSAAIGLASYVTSSAEPGYGIWPRGWPLWLQVIMAIIAAELGFYWAHRIAHEWKLLWRFHAVHHSVIRLWIVNTGRFHFVDSLKSILIGTAILLTFGAPMEVLIWLSAVTAFVGMLTHCNVDMRFGALSWWFNTPELHRWHHSRDLREGNKNYGENIMLWDHVFGTYFNTRDYRPPENIGIDEPMPAGFLQQLAWPFRTKATETD
ncbi:MAG: sterol desaturase family protein [Rhizobiales bacterium]|nr:sterol desaturase family protein [Hyphomicrobiales bacterium]